MTDITKCRGDGCVLRNTCYRFTAAFGTWQSMFSVTPLQENGCEYYWRTDVEVHGRDVSRQKRLQEVGSVQST
jgi:hypothetical protein